MKLQEALDQIEAENSKLDEEIAAAREEAKIHTAAEQKLVEEHSQTTFEGQMIVAAYQTAQRNRDLMRQMEEDAYAQFIHNIKQEEPEKLDSPVAMHGNPKLKRLESIAAKWKAEEPLSVLSDDFDMNTEFSDDEELKALDQELRDSKASGYKLRDGEFDEMIVGGPV
ncbi:MAG: hypothetical protein Q9187_008368 [Circinaria calcarea]